MADTKPPDTDETETGHTGLGKVVVWFGIVFGTAFGILMLTNGITPPQVGGMPPLLGVIVGGLIAYLLIIIITITATELVRRHHRTARQAAGRYARVKASNVHARASLRWQARQSGTQGPGLIARIRARFAGSDDDDPAPASKAPDPKPAPKPSGTNPGGSNSPVASKPGGNPVPAAPRNSRVDPARRADRLNRHIDPGTVPAAWRPVIGAAADFDPENDEHLLAWMTGEIRGMAGYAEALVEAYQTGTLKVGIDPNGLKALHDVADAAAVAAQTMNGAKKLFTDHYELPREFAANGGLMTHDGRWVTGEGS